MSNVTRVVYTPEGFVEPDALQAHSDPHAQPNTEPQTRVVGGTVSFTHGSGSQPQTSAVIRHTEGNRAGTAGGSVLATFRQDGARQSVETIPGVPASRTGVAEAIREGLLRRNGAGHLEDVNGQQAAVQGFQQSLQTPGAQATDPGVDIFDAEFDRAHAETLKGLPRWAVDSATGRLVAWMTHGTGSQESIAARLAKDVGGMDEAKALEHVQGFQALHEAALTKALAPMGLTGERGQAFLKDLQGQPSKFQNALQELLHERNPRGFLAAGAEWVRRNPTAEQAVQRRAPVGQQQGKAVPSSDTATHQAFERAGYSIGTYQNEMFVSKGDGQWVRASEVIGHMLSKVK